MTRVLGQSVLVVVVAFGVGAVILLLTGHDPLVVYRELVSRTLLRRSGLEESLIAATSVLLAAMAAWIAARVGMWNIGIDGQIVAGAVAAGALAPRLDGMPVAAMWLVVTVAGVVAGAMWTLLPALLRVRGGVNEIVTTIMVTYVAFSGASWLVKGPLKDPDLVAPATPVLEVARRLPEIADTRVHAGVPLAVALCLVLWWASRSTVPGLLSRVVGEAPRAAHRVGVRVDRYVVTGFLLSGAVAALAGVFEVIAVRGSMQADWRPGEGLAAFAVLFLARKSVPGLLLAALLLGILGYGATVLPRATDASPGFFPLLEGIILVLLGLAGWRGFRMARRSRSEAAA